MIVLLLLTGNIAIAQKNVYYRSADNTIITAKALEAIIAAKTKKFAKLGFKLKKVVTTKRIAGDSVIYDFTLEATNYDANTNINKYPLLVGKPLPPFATKDVAGNLIDTRKLTGRAMVINMWFTTCLPCIDEMPQLNKVKSNIINKDVVFIAMTFETKRKVLAFLKTNKFNFIQITDQDNYCKLFTTTYPINIFVNKKGIITDIMGGMPMTYADMQKVTIDPASFNIALAKIKR